MLITSTLHLQQKLKLTFQKLLSTKSYYWLLNLRIEKHLVIGKKYGVALYASKSPRRKRLPSMGRSLPAVVPEVDVAHARLPLARSNHDDLVVAFQWFLAASEGLWFGRLGREMPVVCERPRQDLAGEIPLLFPRGQRLSELLCCLFLFRFFWSSSYHGYYNGLACDLVHRRWFDDLRDAQGHCCCYCCWGLIL